MTTEQHLRAVLRRATDPIEPALGEAMARLEAARGKQRRRRVGGASALVAMVAAFTALVVDGQFGGDGVPQPPPSGPAHIVVGPLRPGTYDVRAGFDPPLRLTLPAGWSSQVASPGDIRLVPPDAPGSLVGVADVGRVYEPAGSGVRVHPAPVDLPSWIKGDPDLAAVRAREVRVGDQFGTRIVARVSGHPRLSSSCPGECTEIFDLGGGPLTVPAGRHVAFVLVNDAGEFVTAYAISAPGAQRAPVSALDAMLADLVIGQ